MKAKLTSFYRKDTFNKVFVFEVSGTAEELADYKKSQGNYFRTKNNEPDGAPLFFSNSPNGCNVGQSVSLIPSFDGTRYIVDNTANEIQREMQIEQRMLDLEAQERFNRLKYGNNVNFQTGEVMNEPVAEGSLEEVEEPELG